MNTYLVQGLGNYSGNALTCTYVLTLIAAVLYRLLSTAIMNSVKINQFIVTPHRSCNTYIIIIILLYIYNMHTHIYTHAHVSSYT